MGGKALKVQTKLAFCVYCSSGFINNLWAIRNNNYWTKETSIESKMQCWCTDLLLPVVISVAS